MKSFIPLKPKKLNMSDNCVHTIKTETKHIMSDNCVHFADKLFEVYLIENYCRKGPWEECARDRVRFRRHILEIETVIKPILNQEIITEKSTVVYTTTAMLEIY
jgi:hypothetical protein